MSKATKLSMSMRVDRSSTRTEWTIRPSTPATWIPDARVKICFGCAVRFSTLRRKHHCRSCGRIFCSACSSYREIIPSYYRTFSECPVNIPQRTCAQCAQLLKQVISVEYIIRMLSVMPVHFHELFRLRLLNKKWNYAGNTIFSLFRGLQYKLSCQKYSSIECAFLWAHHKEFHGHIPWQIHVAASLRQQGKLTANVQSLHTNLYANSCRRLLCSRVCHKVLTAEDVIRLCITDSLREKKIQRWIIDAWSHMLPEVHVKMMCWWVYFSGRYINLFRYGLIPICAKRLDLTFALWFECSLQKTPKLQSVMDGVHKLLKQILKPVAINELTKAEYLVTCLQNIIESKTNEKTGWLTTSFFKQYPAVRLPWNPEVIITSMTVIKRLTSSSKPIVLQYTTRRNTTHQILLKREDVRTDRLAMVIGFWINKLTCGICVNTYGVFPLNNQCGVVEMLENTLTLYEIRKRGVSLLNYIMTNNDNLNIQTLRARIISSTAGACLLAFTMGLGDRHLENIMVTKDAHLVHVDFGWVLGDDPKHAHTPMRITDDMVDAMGGSNSSTFLSFIHRTKQGYEHMRQHTSFWYHLMSSEFFIFGDQSRHWKRIRDHIFDRFVPGEWNEEASLQIESVVKKAAQTSWLQSFLDLTHSASNRMDGIFQMDL